MDATALAQATSSCFILLSSLQSTTTGTGTPTDVVAAAVIAGEAAAPFQDDRRRLTVPASGASGTAASFAACRALASKAMAKLGMMSSRANQSCARAPSLVGLRCAVSSLLGWLVQQGHFDTPNIYIYQCRTRAGNVMHEWCGWYIGVWTNATTRLQNASCVAAYTYEHRALDQINN